MTKRKGLETLREMLIFEIECISDKFLNTHDKDWKKDIRINLPRLVRAINSPKYRLKIIKK